MNWGNAGAQFILGDMYEDGRGVSKDEAEVVEWYRKAAGQGYTRTQYNLGYMYANGRGVRKDEAEAVEWYRKAAEQGHAKAQERLRELGK
ncbi:MAG: sel1 repeat family protein [Victivallales bacterium]|nr:sel1 repeat family protein [Victivallales bacterium]